MVNDLNSIILEGVIIERMARSNEQNNVEFVELKIATCRKYIRDGKTIIDKADFFIKVQGRLAKKGSSYLPVGQSIRVVGRLANDSMKGPLIIAEHIELRGIQEHDSVWS